jgi:CCR4-NOT transcription complex subunit 3
LPAALSAFQQQQQSFNEQNRNLGLNSIQTNTTTSSSIVPSNTTTSSSSSSTTSSNSNTSANQQQQSQQITSLSPSSQQQQQSSSTILSTNQETFIQPILGVAPLGKTALTKDQNQQLILLDSAFKKLPHPSDTERIRNYLPRITVNTPNYYPVNLPATHDSLDFLAKLSSETLFFMFYYMEVS